MDYLNALRTDFDRLAEVSVTGPADARVPTCPDWTLTDLDHHVAGVYLHKVAGMRDGAQPPDWSVDLSGEDRVAALRRAYAELTAQFDARAPESPAATWYAPDQTVGFWLRRMAQETVIHRIDAELAAGVPSRPVPDELALDGIDELLRMFLQYGSTAWHEYFAQALAAVDGGSVAIESGDRRWLVTPTPAEVLITEGDGPAAATVRGAPDPVLRWAWRRGDDAELAVTGETERVARLRDLLGMATG
ncbi:maleylpyruvate isomerase family mycothiol-dependent enzyme [Catellatospora tritici]|uniref:maleylpyruvate isomerase family mycothiol-dependent enzyme n=1 Tax=Catellatospora tritici TaxID=2851566 RepID=UPI001C2D6B3A|nr:maleylpyruvate isomerase family mycothiol-dependent enzyme [Catellatospora tritici]MBV1851849.1 maleylpyruvate isomerase family mycothiol-dependent enzyme [Catellatospora tritici]